MRMKDNKFFSFFEPVLKYIDTGKFFREPFRWLYAILAILNLLTPIVLLVMAINNDLFRYGGGRMIAAFILVWLVIAFVSWLGFQIWWNRREKVYAAATAHDDFIFAIIGEELGYIGVVLALLMVFFVAFRAMSIGRKALEIDHRFSGFLACAIGIWFSFQALVNVGAAAGMLPTKGLTLPLISYGGSSLLIMSTAIMLLLRIDYETRLEKAQAFTRGVR